MHAQKQADRVQEDIVRLERFVERFRAKKEKAKQAQAKLTQIGRLKKERDDAADEVALLSRRRRTLGFEFLKPARSGRTVVEVEGLTLRIGERELMHDVSFALERGEHVALVGPNGSGKTTLLETLLGRREAAAGKIRLGHGVEAAYFSQQEMELDTRGTVLQCVQTMTGLNRPDAQSLLGRFLFSGWDEHEKQASVLSGGERRRLALAVTVASGANFLVLDEPTNHLDLDSREALEAALEAFPGTVLLVSHDRALLDAVAERTLAIEDGELHGYDGGWAEMLRRRDQRSAVAAAANRAEKPANEPKPKPAAKPRKKRPSELRAGRGGDRRPGGGGRASRAEARGRLVERRRARRAQARARRAHSAARALGDAVRAGLRAELSRPKRPLSVSDTFGPNGVRHFLTSLCQTPRAATVSDTAGPFRVRHRAREMLLVAAAERPRRVDAVARDPLVPGGLVEAQRLRLAVAGLQHDPVVAEPPRLVLERDEQQAPEPAPARVRDDVHPLQLRPRLVEAADAAAPDRAPLVPDDEEDAVGRHEHRRLACRPDVGLALVQPAHLLLLRVDERRHLGRVERLRTRNAQRRSRVGPP